MINQKRNDHFHSFDKSDLIKFYQKILDARKIIGKQKKNFLKSEVSMKKCKKSLFYNKDLKKNSRIKYSDIISLRPAYRYKSYFIQVIKKKLRFNINLEE